jgi:hypothetical protein
MIFEISFNVQRKFSDTMKYMKKSVKGIIERMNIGNDYSLVFNDKIINPYGIAVEYEIPNGYKFITNLHVIFNERFFDLIQDISINKKNICISYHIQFNSRKLFEHLLENGFLTRNTPSNYRVIG